MKKILSLLGGMSLVISSSSTVVSCFNTRPTNDHTFKDEFEIFDLGAISGVEDTPSVETIYNGIAKAHENVVDWRWAVPIEDILFVNEPTTESCTIRVVEGHDQPTLTGEVQFTYNYKKIENNEIDFYSSGQNKGIIRRTGTMEEISKFSNLVTNWEWIEKINSRPSLAYTDLSNYGSTGGTGLCEYIALNMLINYSQVFGKYNLYSNSDIKKYFYQLDSRGIYHYASGSGNKDAVPYLMYKKVSDKYGGRWYDIRTGKSIRKIMKTWLGDYSKNLIDDYSVSWSHTSNPENWIKKYNRPVLLSFFVKGDAHSVVIYGYNESTNEYAVNYGWPGSQYGRQIIKKSEIWSYFSMGFWYGLRDK
ncbi:putative cysteine peptidase [Spiroplasma floricola]|uniref:Uncharacterized protein n=1 Tax=Spiroplasma floricola 23-6 TaxID=1336749 RepID=A0A2K8SCS1_9MOLU|nr:lipoprotein [Spiroplasma floricola]AUB31254.1 hypothetical protein SFLOR_v1c01930 [Spiroplasma floricola 23-6]